MHKKIASGVIIIAILAFLFSSLTAQAGIIGTIGQKGLAMASPELHTLLQTTACVSTGVTCASNYLAGQVTGEVMQQVAESSPEAAQLLKVNNKVEEWKKYGAQISEDLKVDDKGQIVGGSTTAVTRQIDISSEVGSDLKEGSIVAGPGVKTSFGQEGEDCTMAATEDGSYQKIGDQTYGNLAKGSFTKVSREGELTEAEIQTTEDGTTYIIKDQKFELNKGEKATYKEGKLTFSCVDGEGKDASCAGQTLKINDKDITINKGNIEFDGETFTGEDFTIDGTNVKSLTPGTPAEAKIVDKGLAIRNAVAETDEFYASTMKEPMLITSGCGQVTDYLNYVQTCKGTLTLDSQSQSVSGIALKPKGAKKYGLEMEEGDKLDLSIRNSKMTLESGELTVDLNKNSIVTVQNGDNRIIHVYDENGPRVESIVLGESDVKLVTNTQIEDWNCVVETDESGNTVSYCGDAVSSAETSVTVGGAITEVTGNIILKTKNFFSKITSLDSSTTGAFSSEITGAFDFKKCIENVKQKAGEVTDKVKKKVEEYSEGLKQTKLKIGDYYTDTERELYPGTLKSIEIEGAKCKTCAYYEIKGLDTDGEKKITYIISIDEKSVSGIFEEDEFFSDGPSVTTFNEYEEQALGLKPPVYEGDMSELEERIGEPPDLELYSNGVWYLKDGTIWQAKGDGTVECTNCNDEEEAKHKSFFEK